MFYSAKRAYINLLIDFSAFVWQRVLTGTLLSTEAQSAAPKRPSIPGGVSWGELQREGSGWGNNFEDLPEIASGLNQRALSAFKLPEFCHQFCACPCKYSWKTHL